MFNRCRLSGASGVCTGREELRHQQEGLVPFVSRAITIVIIPSVPFVSRDIIIIIITRSYAALRAADIEWIVKPGYSLGGFILMKNQPGTMKKHEKPTWNHEKP